MLRELHVIVESFLTEVAGKGFVLLGSVRVDDVNVQVLLHLEPLATVLTQVVVERRVDVAVMFFLVKFKLSLKNLNNKTLLITINCETFRNEM